MLIVVVQSEQQNAKKMLPSSNTHSAVVNIISIDHCVITPHHANCMRTKLMKKTLL